MSKKPATVPLKRKPHLPGNQTALANRKERITLSKVGAK
jgi:hypothetical protein